MTPSIQQIAFVDHDGSCMLLACPGSGKTRSVGARAARLLIDGQRLAVCSYTNIGANRIQQAIGTSVVGAARGSSYVGTLHRLLLDYVVYPFAHLAGAEQSLIVTDTGFTSIAVSGDNKKRVDISDFVRRSDGSFRLRKKPHWLQASDGHIAATHAGQIEQQKALALRQGRVSTDDTMWLALILLRNHPWLARAVCFRFDEIIVDEAQDTSELQLSCLEELLNTGALRSLVLVGDVEQSIYSFQGASGDRCLELAGRFAIPVLTLSENYRSSQLICDAAAVFTQRTTDTAVGPHALSAVTPTLVMYRPSEPESVVTGFDALLGTHGIDVGASVILCRDDATTRSVNGVQRIELPRDLQRLLGVAVGLNDGALDQDALRFVVEVLAKSAWGVPRIDPFLYGRTRVAAGRLITSLPALEGDLRSWVRAAGTSISTAAESVVPKLTRTGPQLLPAKESYASVEVTDVLPHAVRAVTIHSFKGDEADAVLVVLPPHKRTSNHEPATSLWTRAVVHGFDTLNEREREELRIAFVAMSRAKQLLAIAVPNQPEAQQLRGLLLQQGFVET